MHRLAVALVVLMGITGCTNLLPTLNVGLGVSAVMPEDTQSLDNTYMADVFVKIDVSFLQIEASVGLKQYQYTEAGGLQPEETLTQMPVAATARFVMGPGLVRFMFGGGLVWIVNDVDEIGSLDAGDSVAYRVLLGVDLSLLKSFRLGVEASYDLSDLAGDQLDSDGAMLRVTLGYHF